MLYLRWNRITDDAGEYLATMLHTHVVRFRPKPPVVQKTVDHRRLTNRRTGGKNNLPGSLVKPFRVTFY
jgi:hypothetical protein